MTCRQSLDTDTVERGRPPACCLEETKRREMTACRQSSRPMQDGAGALRSILPSRLKARELRFRCAPFVPKSRLARPPPPLTCDDAWDRPGPLKAVAPVRIRSGVPTRRALTCGNASQGPAVLRPKGTASEGGSLAEILSRHGRLGPGLGTHCDLPKRGALPLAMGGCRGVYAFACVSDVGALCPIRAPGFLTRRACRRLRCGRRCAVGQSPASHDCARAAAA